MAVAMMALMIGVSASFVSIASIALYLRRRALSD
jgi:hypothetical protein